MKKVTLALTALAMVLTLAQCKKQEPEGDRIVPITLNVQAASKDSKINVDPNTGAVGFEQNDVVYVGSGGKYVGMLTCRGTKFMGNLTNPVEGEPLYFYFLGNKFIYEDDFTPGVSTTASVDIIDQSDPDNLPVISSAVSDQDFTGEGTYTAYFRNRAALVMFNVNTTSTTSPTIIEGMKNAVTVDFVNNTLSYSEMAGGAITLPEGSGERWAILLPQNALAAGDEGSAYSADNAYTGTRGAVPAIVANGYYFEGIPVNVTTATGGGSTLEAPTNVQASLNGSNVLITWNDVDDATYYKVFKSNTSNGTYELLGMTFDTYYEDEYADEHNYYKVSAANSNGESAKSDYIYFHYNPNLPTGAIDGKFTINASGDQVYMSQGNLQYQASTGIWRFAENQWSVIGESNNNISSTYNGWIDLFGWGTSGWNSGNYDYQPYDYWTEPTMYGPSVVGGQDLTGTYANADWGVYNAITNGGNQAGQWRTLSKDEFEYLLFTRTTATGARYAKVELDFGSFTNFPGYILLPDDWDGLVDLTTNDNSIINTITSQAVWEDMLAHGVVFLTGASFRVGNAYQDEFEFLLGAYWTSTHSGDNKAYVFMFNSNSNSYFGVYNDDYTFRNYGLSVRLVQDVQ